MAVTLEQLDARLARIETFLGDIDINHVDDVAGNYHNRKEIANGDFPLAQNIHQLRQAVNEYAEEVVGMRKALASRPSGSVQVPSTMEPAPLPAGNIPTVRELILRAGKVAHRLMNTENDAGLRLCYNFEPGQPDGSSYTDPNLMQLFLFFEQDGVISYTYRKPLSTPAGPFEDRAGKTIAFKPGGIGPIGQPWPWGQQGQYAMIYGGMPGIGLELGMTHAGDEPNEPTPKLRFREEGVFVVDVDGSERQL